MTILYKCDGCGKTVERNVVQDRYKPKLFLEGSEFQLEIIVCKNGTSNHGELCVNCLRKIVRRGLEEKRG